MTDIYTKALNKNPCLAKAINEQALDLLQQSKPIFSDFLQKQSSVFTSDTGNWHKTYFRETLEEFGTLYGVSSPNDLNKLPGVPLDVTSFISEIKKYNF
jgi:beta-galactosidase GanA